jgi:hypothetical protein
MSDWIPDPPFLSSTPEPLLVMTADLGGLRKHYVANDANWAEADIGEAKNSEDVIEAIKKRFSRFHHGADQAGTQSMMPSRRYEKNGLSRWR